MGQPTPLRKSLWKCPDLPLPIKYTKKENGGCASARNRGLKIATGDLFVFLDSDDTLEPTALETLVSRLVESNADLVYSPSIEILRHGIEFIAYPVAVERPRNLRWNIFGIKYAYWGIYIYSECT